MKGGGGEEKDFEKLLIGSTKLGSVPPPLISRGLLVSIGKEHLVDCQGGQVWCMFQSGLEGQILGRTYMSET